MALQLYNTLTRKKEPFTPHDAKNVRMYVCGPTVYDRPHLGNARSVVVYDVLYRLLAHLYGKEHVTYVRNITDVDDKINAAAKENKEPISALTTRVEGWFHDDMKALNVLPASATLSGKKPSDNKGYMGEPHATHHILHMVAMIENLIKNKNAYLSENHVLFSVTSDADYGQLSGRKLDDLIAGARIEVESYKKHPGDFVLWKPAEAGDDPSSVFDSPWGKGRPGWHIECSAMSSTYLGNDFDIHGGGADLMFPHHENEIAQSRCANPGSSFARYWVHNGFLTVGGEKMSKSLGNFTTVRQLLDKGIKGEVIRYALLSTHYRAPLDWTEKLISDSKKELDFFYRVLGDAETLLNTYPDIEARPFESLALFLLDDINFSKFKSELISRCTILNTFRNAVVHHNADTSAKMLEISLLARQIRDACELIGIGQCSYNEWFRSGDGKLGDITLKAHGIVQPSEIYIKNQIDTRIAAKKAKNWAEADKIRKELADQGIILEDRPDGTTDWRRA